MRSLLLIVVVVAVLTTPAAASSDNWWFKTPDDAPYCGTDRTGWICVRPADGLWIRLTGYLGRNVDVRKGTSERFRGLRASVDRTLRFGDVFHSSDAEIITCWSRRTGVTCKHFEGLSFKLGHSRGHRIFWDAPGSPLRVLPLFRTGHGIHCGIDKENLEPSNPILTCWNPADGLTLGVGHPGGRGGHGRYEQAIGSRPRGFPRLGYGQSFEWRCRRVLPTLAENCSTTAGEAVFACTSTRARLTCRNRDGHGFWASARSFYTF